MALVVSIPLAGSQYKAVQPRLVFTPLEFEGGEISVVQPLSYTHKFNGIAVSHPVLDNMVCSPRLFMLGNVGQGNIVTAGLDENSYGGSLYIDARFIDFAHKSSHA